MTRAWLAVAAIGGFLSVMAATIAHHLAADEEAAELLRTGALYGMIHAAVLIALVAIATSRGRLDRFLEIAGCSFTIGILLFGPSLFVLALTGVEWFRWITPIGGVSLLVGWASLAIAALARAG
jgi:uncharacterized membrane protein YgdD (TMEM256/DUF423 family)